jgi:hypothetical protein
MDFYRTVGGRRFIDHTIPDLIRQLEKVHVAVDRLADVLEGARREAARAEPTTESSEKRT